MLVFGNVSFNSLADGGLQIGAGPTNYFINEEDTRELVDWIRHCHFNRPRYGLGAAIMPEPAPYNEEMQAQVFRQQINAGEVAPNY